MSFFVKQKIRSIIAIQRGITCDFGGKLVTVHSTGHGNNYEAAVLILDFDDSYFLIGRALYFDADETDYTDLSKKFVDFFTEHM